LYRRAHKQLQFIQKIIFGDSYYIGEFVDNKITDGFTYEKNT
jgi:hypothetical protein